NVLEVDEHTGVNEVYMDPRNPHIMYASTWQRRRHVWTLVSGGPGTAIYKSTDGGDTWSKSQKGIPGGDLGRIGMAISPVNPDILFAIIEASNGKGGVYRSVNRGASWEKRSSYSTSGNYYQEIMCDLVDVDRVYSMNTWAQVSDDGGKSWKRLGERSKHVDNHALWIDPAHPDHYLIGCDGGIYESFDRAKTWTFKANLPITQFYKVAVDNAEPFYHVYGGTQDNFSMGGPSRTTNAAGIVNSDWYITNGGDGFESQVDPDDPNIVYAQSQYGGLTRFDKKSGEGVSIKPQPKEGEAAFRWNWDAPLLISPHNGKTLYFAANKLFKSTDRGSSWQAISGDLSRQLDRNKLPVMGRVWGMDAVAKNVSTTIYGNIVALDESPLKQGLLYIGTDDGLVHVSEDDGQNWRKIDNVAGVPERTYVNMLLASQHDDKTVYAAFNNHKNGDFLPYLYKSTDRGNSWTNISANLPERGSVYAIAEDHIDPNLLFAGTEFGLFVSVNGGTDWTQLKSGLPTIAVRDLAIQKRENDLILASFGRGFYVLDDYSALRTVNKDLLAKEAHIFPVKKALMFLESMPLGLPGKSFQGESYYSAKNPAAGATFTYYVKEKPLTLKETRQKKEKELVKNGEAVPYPSFEEMEAEDNEEKPYLLFTVKSSDGEIVRRLKTSARKGINRINWDFRYPSQTPISLRKAGPPNPFSSAPQGHLAIPGAYSVSMSMVHNGVEKMMVDNVAFDIEPLNNLSLPAADQQSLVEFQQKVGEMQRSFRAISSLGRDMNNQVRHIKEAIRQSDLPAGLLADVRSLEDGMRSLQTKLNGDRTKSRRQFETLPGLVGRIQSVVYGLWYARSAPTTTQMEQFKIVSDAYPVVLKEVKALVDQLTSIQNKLEDNGAPYTPGRLPKWLRD
ncbi:MAG: glycosyl hydrolase, partial [Bacteroidota bacterium]